MELNNSDPEFIAGELLPISKPESGNPSFLRKAIDPLANNRKLQRTLIIQGLAVHTLLLAGYETILKSESLASDNAKIAGLIGAIGLEIFALLYR